MGAVGHPQSLLGGDEPWASEAADWQVKRRCLGGR